MDDQINKINLNIKQSNEKYEKIINELKQNSEQLQNTNQKQLVQKEKDYQLKIVNYENEIYKLNLAYTQENKPYFQKINNLKIQLIDQEKGYQDKIDKITKELLRLKIQRWNRRLSNFPIYPRKKKKKMLKQSRI